MWIISYSYQKQPSEPLRHTMEVTHENPGRWLADYPGDDIQAILSAIEIPDDAMTEAEAEKWG
mgnify:CR=1 FL=1